MTSGSQARLASENRALARRVFARRIFSEWLGTALLLAGVVGSGIMAERLSGGNMAVALLANAIATGALLPVLITVFGPVSGAHFNPWVTVGEAWHRRKGAGESVAYVLAQGFGAWCGVLLAHAMFALPLVQASQKARGGAAQMLSEAVATFGLMLLLRRVAPSRPHLVPALVGLYITAAYWFTASTSFANPAVTLARAFTDTFAGIDLHYVPAFIAGQALGFVLAEITHRILGET
jgi:glycerol uptake facilitator-like aquaporin